ncbi:MAG: efflux RND transporter permease subunit, partial [Opitutales bacterium]
ETNDEIFSRLRDELDEAAREFPPDVLAPVLNDDRGAVAYTLIIGLTWEGANDEAPPLNVLNRAAESLRDRLRNVSGTDIVDVVGEPEEEIRVELDPAAISAAGLTVERVARALENADARVAAGRFRSETASLIVEVEGAFDTTERIREVPLLTSQVGAVLRLGEVATVTRAWQEPPASVACTNGQRTLLVAARVLDDRRIGLWTDESRAVVNQMQAELGETIRLRTVFEQNEYTADRLASLAFNLFLGGCVIFLVILVTMGWKASLIVGSALPLTAAMTLGVIGFTGGKLHQMSIFGMIIALGLLIDSAIVVADEIRNERRGGTGPMDAVRQTVRHLFVPLLSSTVTTILAFMPILLLPGNAGDFVGSIGGSVIVALACSFFVAMLLVSSLAGRFLGPGRESDARRGPWWRGGVHWPFGSRVMRGLAGFAVRRPLWALLASVVVPAAGFLSASTLGVQFFPRVDRDMFGLKVWLPTSTPIEETIAISEAIKGEITTFEGVTGQHWVVGESFPPVYYNLLQNQDRSPFFAQAIIEATDFQTVKALIPQLQTHINERFPEAQPVFEQFGQGPPATAGVEIRLFGPSVSELQRIGGEIRGVLARHPDVVATRVTMPGGEPKLSVIADEATSLGSGFSLRTVAGQLQARLDGRLGGTLLEGVEDLPVRVRYPSEWRGSLDSLASAPLLTGEPGVWVPLDALATIELKPEPGAITRRNAQRVNAIRGWVKNEALPIDVTTEVMDELERSGLTLPDGYRLGTGGTSENQSDAVGNLLLYVPVLGVLMIAVMVLTFRSARLAAALGVLAALSVGYGLLATWAYGLAFSFNTILGCFGLIGLALNDAIVVMASIRAHAPHDRFDPDATRDAVLRTSRHLVSTTLTTIGSFLPLLIFVGGEFWPPLAIVLAGGAAGATALAVVFAPAAYTTLIFRLRGDSSSEGTEVEC